MPQEMPWAIEAAIKVDNAEEGSAAMRLDIDKSPLRPGGSVSGPTMMLLSDVTMYGLVLGTISNRHISSHHGR